MEETSLVYGQFERWSDGQRRGGRAVKTVADSTDRKEVPEKKKKNFMRELSRRFKSYVVEKHI